MAKSGGPVFNPGEGQELFWKARFITWAAACSIQSQARNNQEQSDLAAMWMSRRDELAFLPASLRRALRRSPSFKFHWTVGKTSLVLNSQNSEPEVRWGGLCCPVFWCVSSRGREALMSASTAAIGGAMPKQHAQQTRTLLNQGLTSSLSLLLGQPRPT
ncbi:hypothetical protein N657DRAFT_72896 [Parathielavia appendiculata]|uniref:Uncharacterized protein n=1 Tax=Parathielavia appendiculata TaxID=2587402 RepID=A0AAN6UAD9_9PEZI|nr:hypothetical protein N657DRAFT_72896 [Parathielavia appendiculata]